MLTGRPTLVGEVSILVIVLRPQALWTFRFSYGGHGCCAESVMRWMRGWNQWEHQSPQVLR